jgi:hypothetical protein
MNQMIEALQGIMNQAQGETLDVPHPVDVKNVRTTPLTGWHFSVLKADREKQDDGDWNTEVVQGRIVENVQLDQWGEPIGEPRLLIQHKYGTPARQSKDVSVTALKPNVVRSMKERFPGAFQEYETKLLRGREEVPLALLDSVPPEVLQVIWIMGARSVQQFAAFDDAKMAELREKLLSAKMAARANYLGDYLQRARDLVGDSPTPRGRKAAA